MKTYMINQDYYRLKYSYQLSQSLFRSMDKIIDLHINIKQKDSFLFWNQSNLNDFTVLNFVEIFTKPLDYNIKITTGIKGVIVRLDLLTSTELSAELDSLENLRLIITD